MTIVFIADGIDTEIIKGQSLPYLPVWTLTYREVTVAPFFSYKYQLLQHIEQTIGYADLEWDAQEFFRFNQDTLHLESFATMAAMAAGIQTEETQATWLEIPVISGLMNCPAASCGVSS